MNLQRFNDHCQNLISEKSSEKIFFQFHDKTLTYRTFLKNAVNLACQLEQLKENFLALKLSQPDVMFTYLFAALISHKKVLLLSVKEPDELTKKHQNHIPYECLIDDSCIFKYSHSPQNKTSINFKTPFEEPFLFVLSSGSGGDPKGIGHSLSTLAHSSLSLIKALSMREGEKTFLNLPHSHVGGLMTIWRAFFSQGIIDMRGENFDYLSLVPLQLQRALSSPSEVLKLKKTKAVLIGGSLLNAELKFKSLKLNIPLYETYGMTETCSLIMLNGIPLEGQIIRLSSDETILIKGPTLSPGYFQNGVFYQLPLNQDLFYQTSDRGVKSDEGLISFVERKDLLFKSGGELINPLIIEASVRELDWIKDCVVVPVPHYEWGQAACLLFEKKELTLNDKKAQEEITAFLKNRLHPYLVPKYFFSHPLSFTGLKPGRFELTKVATLRLLKTYFSFDFFPSKEEQKTLWIFFHGFMGNKTDFEKIFKLMEKPHSASFLFIDLPGHGETKIDTFTSRQEVFLKIKELITFFQNKSELIFYGYSMGGRIALELSLDYLSPQKLILESASFGLISEEEKAERCIADSKLFKDPLFNTKDFLHTWYASSLFEGYNQSPDYKTELEKKSLHDYREWEKSLNFFSPGRGMLLNETLSKLKTKSFQLMVISGRKDKKYQDHFTLVQNNLVFKRFDLNHAAHNPHKTHAPDIAEILNS